MAPDQEAVSFCPQCLTTYASSGLTFCPQDGVRLQQVRRPGTAWIGRAIQGTYRVLRYIDAGGMAEIYEAEHVTLGHRVAIKMMRRHLASDPQMVERFVREAKLISLIRHPNVISLEHAGALDDGTMFMVVELLRGRSLEAALAAGPLPPALAFEIAIQACDGMQAAHDRNVVHRDLKPGNIYLDEGPDGLRVKILDLGVAKLDEPEAHSNLTMVGTTFGTPEYMSPEQATGRRVDHRADIYSLGIVLFRMLTGGVPFTGASFMAILTRHISEAPRWPAELARQIGLPPATESVVLRALAKNPSHRFPSMADFRAALVGLRDALVDGQVGPAQPRETLLYIASPPALSSGGQSLRAGWNADAKAIEIAPDVHWVGRRERVVLERNSYLRVYRGQGRQISVVIDPGPPKDLACLTAKVESVIGGLKAVDIVFLNHQDPDVGASTPAIQEANPEAHVWCSQETWRLVQFYGLRPGSYSAVEDFPERRVKLATGHEIEFVPTPFCHFRGATMFYDRDARLLFSGDLFGGLSGSSVLVADERSWPGIELFHQLYMASNKALRLAVDAVRRLDPQPIMIAPQHGGLLCGEWMEEVLRRIAALPAGLDLLADGEGRADHLGAINGILAGLGNLLGEQAVSEALRAFSADGTFPNLFVFDGGLRVREVKVEPRAAMRALVGHLTRTASPAHRPIIEELVGEMLPRHGVRLDPRPEDSDEDYAAIEISER